MTDILREEIFEYLDDLRESGVTNMYGSPAYVEREFSLGSDEALAVVSLWMKTFDRDKTAADRAKEASL